VAVAGDVRRIVFSETGAAVATDPASGPGDEVETEVAHLSASHLSKVQVLADLLISGGEAGAC
jgi:hypothetical protein